MKKEKKDLILSIGNSIFISRGGEGVIPGKEILETLNSNGKFIWNALSIDVTDKIRHIKYDENEFYSFQFDDETDNIIVRRFDMETEKVIYKDDNLYNEIYDYIKKNIKLTDEQKQELRNLEPKISYECSEIIEELEQDILQYGNINMYAFFRIIENFMFLVDYTLISEELPLTKKELGNDVAIIMKAKDILKILKKQNELI